MMVKVFLSSFQNRYTHSPLSPRLPIPFWTEAGGIHIQTYIDRYTAHHTRVHVRRTEDRSRLYHSPPPHEHLTSLYYYLPIILIPILILILTLSKRLDNESPTPAPDTLSDRPPDINSIDGAGHGRDEAEGVAVRIIMRWL